MAGICGAIRSPIRYSTTIVSLNSSARTVTALLSDGTRGGFDLVVAADGIHSAVRRVIYPDVQPVYRSFCAWRIVLDCSDCDKVLKARSAHGLVLGSFQVGPNPLYVFLLAHYAEPPSFSREGHLERFKSLARQFDGTVTSLIQQQTDLTRIVFVTVPEVEIPSYYRDRILLIGDAAHAFPPLLAQGAAMAIEDAVALSELLGYSADIDEALRSYQARRRPRVETIRAAIRHREIVQALEGSVTPELLKLHPPVFSNSLKVYDDLIEDPLAHA
jgi:2-polyprenyl-6-methoxyphenol hydroxylase-like FAD-dependent oxidoreductase